MREIDVNINKAKILSFAVELKDGSPEIAANIGLFSGEKKISDFWMRTAKWHDFRFELPAEMVIPITDIALQLETVVVRKLNESLKRLPKSESINNQ